MLSGIEETPEPSWTDMGVWVLEASGIFLIYYWGGIFAWICVLLMAVVTVSDMKWMANLTGSGWCRRRARNVVAAAFLSSACVGIHALLLWVGPSGLGQ